MMNRREFIQKSSAAAMICSLPASAFALDLTARFKLGYQLYSIRDEMEKNPLATLQLLKSFGYEDFEHYGFDPEKMTYYGFKISEFKNRIADMGLTISSGHYNFAQFLDGSSVAIIDYTNRCIDAAITMESKYIIWPWLPENHRNVDGFKKTAALLNEISIPIQKAGLQLAYHNHGFDFYDLGTTNGFQIIAQETDPLLVKLQLDMYWVMHDAPKSPKEFVEQFPGRITTWHIKDMHKESRDYTELGNGSINYQEIMPDPAVSGLEYFYIEQGGNYSQNSIKSAESSARYFKKELQHLL